MMKKDAQGVEAKHERGSSKTRIGRGNRQIQLVCDRAIWMERGNSRWGGMEGALGNCRAASQILLGIWAKSTARLQQVHTSCRDAVEESMKNKRRVKSRERDGTNGDKRRSTGEENAPLEMRSSLSLRERPTCT